RQLHRLADPRRQRQRRPAQGAHQDLQWRGGWRRRNLAALVGDMKGVFTAPIDYKKTNGKITVKAGKLAEGAGEELQGQAGGAIVVSNAMYPLPEVRAGKATKSKVDAGGLTFDSNGS